MSGSDTRTLEEPVSVIVSKAPVNVRLEVDGQVSAPIMVVNIRETTSKQVIMRNLKYFFLKMIILMVKESLLKSNK